MNNPTLVSFATSILVLSLWSSALPSDRWFPVQAVPKGVVTSGLHEGFEQVKSPGGQSTIGGLGATHMMVQSIAGLAAAAVNRGELDEMVWIGANGPDYARWYGDLVGRLKLQERGIYRPWELVRRYHEKGIIKGYILYSFDYSDGDLYGRRKNLDNSVNVATSVAGILEGILIEEGQQAQAEALGLKMLLDARDKSLPWCFQTYRDRLNRNMICAQDPRVPHIRALAIGHRCMTVYGIEEPTPAIMAWLEPLSPVLGWNEGDEGVQTSLSSDYGHFQTATNWSLNLPILSAGADDAPVKKVRNVDPQTLDWDRPRHAASFVMSDGDNVQWLMFNFCLARPQSYWNNPLHGTFPFSWTTPLGHLVQICPEVARFLAQTQPDNVSLIELGGGYYYPDLFGRKRTEKDLLARHARRLWTHMQKAGVKVLAMNCQDLDSRQALAAYRTYAQEMDGLLGMLAIQYYPYEGGAGEVFWVKNRHGIEIPVVTCKYSIWANVTGRPRIGTPAKIARLINREAATAAEQGRRSYSWTVVHSWSFFKQAAGSDDQSENMPQEDASQRGGQRGVAPVKWCIDRLAPQVKPVNIEELLWRIRMDHNPQHTRDRF